MLCKCLLKRDQDMIAKADLQKVCFRKSVEGSAQREGFKESVLKTEPNEVLSHCVRMLLCAAASVHRW